jgi:hypothetical protein
MSARSDRQASRPDLFFRLPLVNQVSAMIHVDVLQNVMNGIRFHIFTEYEYIGNIGATGMGRKTNDSAG